MPDPRAENRGQQLRLDLQPADPRPGGAEQQPRLGARGEAGLEEILALAEEKALALAAAMLAQARTSFSFSFCGLVITSSALKH